MRLCGSAFAVVLFFSSVSHAQKILVDEGWGSSNKLQASYNYESFSDILELRAKKKLALQTTISGATGLIGLNADLNFTKHLSFSLGVGVSRGFNAFNTHFKYFMGGNELSPYFVGGFSRWTSDNAEGQVTKTSPAVLKEKFLSRRELQTGEFAENIIYPGLGLQYVNTSGEWTGFGVFGELLLLVDLDDIELGPAAGIGTVYYF